MMRTQWIPSTVDFCFQIMEAAQFIASLGSASLPALAELAGDAAVGFSAGVALLTPGIFAAQSLGAAVRRALSRKRSRAAPAAEGNATADLLPAPKSPKVSLSSRFV